MPWALWGKGDAYLKTKQAARFNEAFGFPRVGREDHLRVEAEAGVAYGSVCLLLSLQSLGREGSLECGPVGWKWTSEN